MKKSVDTKKKKKVEKVYIVSLLKSACKGIINSQQTVNPKMILYCKSWQDHLSMWPYANNIVVVVYTL